VADSIPPDEIEQMRRVVAEVKAAAQAGGPMRVELRPDYGGAAFRINGLGYADFDRFRPLISAGLQSDIEAWYQIYNHDDWERSAPSAWRVEAERLARRLQDELGSRYDVTVSLDA
jgi:hypothetical protein